MVCGPHADAPDGAADEAHHRHAKGHEIEARATGKRALPLDDAAIILILASKGISEEKVRWHLSPARIYAYLHAAQAMEGSDMVWPSSRIATVQHQERAWERYRRYRQMTAAH